MTPAVDCERRRRACSQPRECASSIRTVSGSVSRSSAFGPSGRCDPARRVPRLAVISCQLVVGRAEPRRRRGPAAGRGSTSCAVVARAVDGSASADVLQDHRCRLRRRRMKHHLDHHAARCYPGRRSDDLVGQRHRLRFMARPWRRRTGGTRRSSGRSSRPRSAAPELRRSRRCPLSHCDIEPVLDADRSSRSPRRSMPLAWRASSTAASRFPDRSVDRSSETTGASPLPRRPIRRHVAQVGRRETPLGASASTAAWPLALASYTARRRRT